MKKNVLKLSLTCLLLVFALVCNGKNNSLNAKKYTIEYKFAKGDSFKLNMQIDMMSNLEFMDTEMSITSEMIFNTDYNITDVKDNLYTMMLQFPKVSMSLNFNNELMKSFDSETDKDLATMEDMSPMLKAMTKVPITIIVDRKGKVQSVSGYDKLREEVINSFDPDAPEMAKQQLLAMLNQMITDKSMKNILDNVSGFPDRAVAIGESWDANMNVSHVGLATNFETTMDVTRKMTLDSVAGNVATISCKGTISVPTSIAQGAPNGQDIAVSLSGTQDSYVQIDIRTGAPMGGKITQKYEGTSGVGEMQMPMTITSVTTITNK